VVEILAGYQRPTARCLFSDVGAKFVLRFGGRGSKGGLCLQAAQARDGAPAVFGKCKGRKNVFRRTSSGALASVAFRGFYIRLSAGRLVMSRGARSAAKFKFTGGKIKVKSSSGGRYMYVQSQGGARASMGMKVVATSTQSRSFMKFSCMSEYHFGSFSNISATSQSHT
jgi:hypothetical protein